MGVVGAGAAGGSIRLQQPVGAARAGAGEWREQKMATAGGSSKSGDRQVGAEGCNNRCEQQEQGLSGGSRRW